MNKHWTAYRSWIALGVASTVALLGCGSAHPRAVTTTHSSQESDVSPSQSVVPPTRAQKARYIAAVDVVCARFRERHIRDQRAWDNATTLRALIRANVDAASSLREELAEMKAVPLPSHSSIPRELLALQALYLRSLDNLTEAARHRNGAAIRANLQIEQVLGRKLDTLGARYGFRICGQWNKPVILPVTDSA